MIDNYDRHRADAENHCRRCYSLTNEELQKLLDRWQSTGRFPSPYAKGVYTYVIDALVVLGINKVHPVKLVMDQMQVLMSQRSRRGKTDWEHFVAPSKGDHPISPLRKVINNINAMRRLGGVGATRGHNPVGYKLMQMGVAIEVFHRELGVRHNGRRTTAPFVRLNTHSDIPKRVLLSAGEAIPEVNRQAPTKGPG